MGEAHIFAIGLALAALAGVRVYLTVFGVGLAGLMGWVDLPQALQVTQSPWGLGTAGVLATGAGAALATHLLKSGSRAMINASPEPVSNWTASLGEDTVTLGGLALAFSHPWLALALVLGLVASVFIGVAWLAKRLVRGIIPSQGAQRTS